MHDQLLSDIKTLLDNDMVFFFSSSANGEKQIRISSYADFKKFADLHLWPNIVGVLSETKENWVVTEKKLWITKDNHTITCLLSKSELEEDEVEMEDRSSHNEAESPNE